MKIQRKGGLIRLRPEKYEEYKDRSYTYQESADRPRSERPSRAIFGFVFETLLVTICDFC